MFRDSFLPLLESSGLSQKQISAMANIPPQHLGKMLNGERSPSYANIHDFANALKVDVSALFPPSQFACSQNGCPRELQPFPEDETIVPFSGGNIVPIINNKNLKILMFTILLNRDIVDVSVKGFLNSLNGLSSRFLIVNSGKVMIKYEHSIKKLVDGQSMKFTGYEITISAMAGTQMTINVFNADPTFTIASLAKYFNHHYKTL